MQPGDRDLLEPSASERLGMLGRRRLHSDGYLPVGDVHRLQSSDLLGERSVPSRRHMQSWIRDLFEPSASERLGMLGRRRLHPDGHLSDGDVHGLQSGDLYGE